MAKNSEVYKTAQERAEAFRRFCTKSCSGCSLDKLNLENRNEDCAFAWLDLEAAEELLPCLLCGAECKAESLRVKCTRCTYLSPEHWNPYDAIAAHNRVAKKCMEGKE